MTTSAPPPTSLAELALLFARLGTTAFGGPAVHIAMMREEVVVRRRWLTEEAFLDALGAAQIVPGPTSTELAIHIGWLRRRWAGLLVAGLAFIVPAVVITGALAWVYVRYGTVPAARGILYGVQPIIIAVVVQAIWGLAPAAARTWPLRAVTALAIVAATVGLSELWILLGAGALALIMRAATSRGDGSTAPRASILPLLIPLAATTTTAAAAVAANPTLLFLVFAKIGSLLFGSGYVLLAFLRAELIEARGWITETQLIDAVAVGQVTPGPVFTTATFIGWIIGGPSGGLAATAGIFLPAFVFVAISGPLIPRLRRSPHASAFLDGVNAASLALMAVVTFQLARAAIVDVPTAALALVGAFLLVRVRARSTWLVVGGAVAGLLLRA